MQAIAQPPPVVTEQQDAADVAPDLPTEQRPDGALVIDLTPLAPPPTECAELLEPDPFDPEIVVCGETVLSPRIGPDYGPSAAELVEGSAIPRARVYRSPTTPLPRLMRPLQRWAVFTLTAAKCG